MSATQTEAKAPAQQAVPETLLKKRKANEKVRQEALAKRKLEVKEKKNKRQVIFKRAEKYVTEYRRKEAEETRLRRVAKSSGNFYIPAEPKVFFVLRLKGIMEIAPKPRKILQLLRLLQINNGTFIKATKATMEMLRLVEPYVTWGEPNLATIRKLIYKRGYAKVNRQRIPLSDNSIIESALGKHDIICIEDLVHEIANVGPAFKQANNFLWAFKLSNPTGGFGGRKFIGYAESTKGNTGYRGTSINTLIKQMA